MFYDIHSYKMISNKRIYVKYFLFTGAKRIRKRYASVLNHLLYEFFLLRSTIITTTIAAIERIANNPIWAVSPVFTVFTTSTNFWLWFSFVFKCHITIFIWYLCAYQNVAAFTTKYFIPCISCSLKRIFTAVFRSLLYAYADWIICIYKCLLFCRCIISR